MIFKVFSNLSHSVILWFCGLHSLSSSGLTVSFISHLIISYRIISYHVMSCIYIISFFFAFVILHNFASFYIILLYFTLYYLIPFYIVFIIFIVLFFSILFLCLPFSCIAFCQDHTQPPWSSAQVMRAVRMQSRGTRTTWCDYHRLRHHEVCWAAPVICPHRAWVSSLPALSQSLSVLRGRISRAGGGIYFLLEASGSIGICQPI